MGPSSSHTMASRQASEKFASRANYAAKFRVTLYSSLALTAYGHLTHDAIIKAFSPRLIEIIDKSDEELPLHPNAMVFEALDENCEIL